MTECLPSITLRPCRADDIEQLWALHQRSETHDRVPRVLELDELRDELDDVRIVLATDVCIADLDGRLAGYAYTQHLPSDIRLERCFVLGEVDPQYRGRGVGRVLLAWGIERARVQLESSANDLPAYVRVDSYDYIESAQRLFARAGFTPVRWFEELLRPLDRLPAQTGVDGIDIVDWPADRDDEIRTIKNEAFADHWGSTPTTIEHWDHQVRGFGARPDLSSIAVERGSGRIVSLCLNHRYPADDELLGRRDGWIDTLGTLREWRGRGLASALITDSLHRFAAAGLTHASIGVDGDSPTGAARLYRSLGFERRQRSITWEIAVR
jgi:mycothiol synthase